MAATVICGVDHSPTAHAVVEAAAAVAHGLGARLVLAHSRDGGVVPLGRATPHPGFPGWAPADPGWEISAEALLAELTRHAGDALTEVIAFDGDPARGLCRLAEGADAPLLVVGSRGRGLVGSLLVGSVSADTVRRAGCPVMIVPDGALGDVERPVVDGATVVCGVATRSDAHLAHMAAELATHLDLRLRLIHVLPPLSAVVAPPLDESQLSGDAAAGAAPDAREASALLRWVADAIVTRRPELAERTDWRLCSGRPGEALAELAARSRAAVVVVGTAGHGVLGAAVSRSPAWTLARVATVPVMVCRDDVATMA